MADYVLSADGDGRQRYRDLDTGKLMPVGWSPPRRTSSTSTIVGQLSSESQSTMFGRLADASSRVGGMIRSQSRGGTRDRRRAVEGLRGIGRFVGDYNEFLDDSTRANPYGGYVGDDQRTDRYTGFEGYYGESEFEDPFSGDVRFYAGDARRILQGMAPETVARLQERMKSLGFISGNYAAGAVLPETEQAFSDLLAESNRRGMTWGSTLGELEQMYEELGLDADADGSERAPFVAPTYLGPDYATLAQNVKDQFRSVLGREADDSEMAMLTAELSGWDREAFDTEVAAARGEYDAAEEGRDTPGVAQTVDPIARFRESFEKRFAGELRGIKRKAETQEQQELMQASISKMSQMLGGPG